MAQAILYIGHTLWVPWTFFDAWYSVAFGQQWGCSRWRTEFSSSASDFFTRQSFDF